MFSEVLKRIQRKMTWSLLDDEMCIHLNFWTRITNLRILYVDRSLTRPVSILTLAERNDRSGLPRCVCFLNKNCIEFYLDFCVLFKTKWRTPGLDGILWPGVKDLGHVSTDAGLRHAEPGTWFCGGQAASQRSEKCLHYYDVSQFVQSYTLCRTGFGFA